MKRLLAIAAAPAALTGVALIVAGCGGGGGSAAGGAGAGYSASTTGPIAQTVTVDTRKTKLGTVLVDGRGRTMYLFEKDTPTASNCTGACASVWPPLTCPGKSVASGGLAAAKLGTLKRADGTRELTYGGHPLYTYAGDAKPGDTRGQGLDQFGAEWYVLAPSGRKLDTD
jgi:predicted lipoprotein with Yx(FWY)xxD motif